jgi:serine phosphatase RsbU (regulator of sigma subunit)
MCIILIVSYIKFRERNLRIKNKELEDKVEERTLEIVQQKSEIEKKNEHLNQAYDEIKLQKDIIEEKQLNITSSIKYAKHIQESVLQSKDILRCFFDDSFVLYKPKDIVSGDFYWVKDKGDELLVVAADCTGHGVPGAFMSLLGISLLNRITETQNITDPAQLLDKMRKNIINSLNQNEDQATFRDGMDATIIKVNKETGKLVFSGANNPIYHIRNSALNEIKGDKMPVSLHSVMNKFTNHELQLTKGDTIYMFSDGYPDQFGGPKGKKLKYKQFKELLIKWSSASMEEQYLRLEEYFKHWKGDFEQIDDIVILGIRF